MAKGGIFPPFFGGTQHLVPLKTGNHKEMTFYKFRNAWYTVSEKS